MVVQHNMQALNANRMLGITTGQQAKSTEKLSSGYRINRAADDAAGLSISEKMRKQIKGLDQASTNAQDGISAVQTAEGALTEVHSMLQRMNELAVQAANGTNSESDRESIQNEIDQLTTEIDRVAETTKFNEAYLLKGNGKATTVKIDAKDAGIPGNLTGVGTGVATFKMEALKTGEQITIGSKGYTIASSVKEVRDIVENAAEGTKVTVNGTNYTVAKKDGSNVDTTENILTNEELTKLVSDGDKIIVGPDTFVAMEDGEADYMTAAEAAEYFEGTKATEATIDGEKVVVKATADDEDIALTDLKADAATIKGKVANGKTVVVEAADGTKTTYVATTDGTGGAANEKSVTEVQTAIEALDPGAKVTISSTADGSGLVTYEIGENGDDTLVETSDLEGSVAGVKAAIEGLEDGAELEINGRKIIIGTAPAGFNETDGVGDNDASLITKEKAYELIMKELELAGSVGADPGSEASVTGEYPLDPDAKEWTFNITEGEVETKQGLQFSLHVGADADENNKIALTIDAMDTTSLGVNGINVVDNTGAKATYAIDSIADAIAKVSAQRSELGAIQNRLEHTIANLDNVVENTTAAESAIRDTDMAEQMVDFSKNNILMQAGQSMLTQANQAKQGVLSLLG